MILKTFRSNGTCAVDGCLRPWDTRFDKSSTLARSLGDFRGFCLCEKHTREAVNKVESSRADEKASHEGRNARSSTFNPRTRY
jgi:hypothetical protein